MDQLVCSPPNEVNEIITIIKPFWFHNGLILVHDE